jgi:hypothetical protein
MGTTEFLIAGATIALVYELLALYFGWQLISNAYNDLADEWNPVVVYVGGTLVGHFWVQPPAWLSPASVMPEYAEVGLVLTVALGLYLFFRRRRDLLPLSWLTSLALIVGAVLWGGFAWTIGI